MQHSDLERLLAKQGQQLIRQLYQDCVDEQAQGEVADEVVDAQGRQRTRTRQQHRELETIFGTVEVNRTGYGAQGEASLHPLDAQLNLPAERYSLEVRRRTALEASKSSFDETVQTLSRYTGAEIGKRQVEELVKRAAEDFDAFYEQRHQDAADRAAAADQAAADQTAEQPQAATDALPADALLVITSDGKGVVMHRQDLRPATRTASERTPARKMGTRLSRARNATASACPRWRPSTRWRPTCGSPSRCSPCWPGTKKLNGTPRGGPARSTNEYGRACSTNPGRCWRRRSAKPCSATRTVPDAGWRWSTATRRSWTSSKTWPSSTTCT